MPSRTRKKKSVLNTSGPDLEFDICGDLTTDSPEWLEKGGESFLLVRERAEGLLHWFSKAGTSSSYLKFSSELTKNDRAFVHNTVASAWSSALETSSSGVGEERHISIYLKGHAPKLPASKMSEAMMKEAIQIWKAARDAGNGGCSRDEVLEQLSSGQLSAPLQIIRDEMLKTRDAVKLLVAAACSGDVMKIEEICNQHPGVARVCHPDLETGYLPLHAAAREGMLDAVKALVSAGAKMDSLDDRGRTPLQVAQSFDQCDAEAVLLQLGAVDPDGASFPLVGESLNLGLNL